MQPENVRLVLEAARFLALVVGVAAIAQAIRRDELERENGWACLLSGTACLAIGGAVDAAQGVGLFPLLGTPASDFVLKEMVGGVAGPVLVAVGLWRWLPVQGNRRRRTRGMLKEAQRVAHVGSWWWGADGSLEWSDETWRILGLRPGASAPAPGTLLERVHPEDRGRVREEVARAVATATDIELGFRIVRPDGAIRHVRSRAVVERSGPLVRGILGTCQDVTESVEREETLRRTRAQFARLLNSIDGIVWEIDPETLRFTFVSEQVRDILGYTVDEVVSDEDFWRRMVHADDQERFFARYAIEVEAGRSHTQEFRAVKADGGVRWLRDVTTVDVEDGRKRVLGVLFDVTEQRELERETAAHREALARQERLSALGTLVAGVAHEINNPLTYMRGGLEVAQLDLAAIGDSVPAEDRQRIERQMATAIGGIERIAEIVKALRAVARKGTGRCAPVDLNDIARDVETLTRVGLPDSVEVSFAFAPGPVRVLGDAGELHQVVLNLVRNAVDATASRGGRVNVRTFVHGGHACMSVVDDGPGIPRATIDRLFTPFYTTKPDGTGLGLPIAESIVRAHRGMILVDSVQGEGATFEIRLPPLDPVREAPAPRRPGLTLRPAAE